MIPFKNFIDKGNNCNIVMVAFPHKEDAHRNLREENPGRYLGPHCMLRFLPEIAFLNPNKYPQKIFSHIGDIIRPKQHYQEHKYQVNAKYSYEELLELNSQILNKHIFSLQKQLIFLGSSFEPFSSCFQGYYQVNSQENFTFIIFSPFLYLERYYNDTNISTDSSIRYLYNKLKELNIVEKSKIIFIGTQDNCITQEENDFLNEMKNFEILNCRTDYENIEKKLQEIEKQNSSIFIGFSFNVIDTQYFWGKNHHFLETNFDSRNTLKLFRQISKWKNLKALQIYDFNPQKEDYGSGIFYAKLLYEFIINNEKIN